MFSFPPLSRHDEAGIRQALRLHDRVHHIDLYLSTSTLHKLLMLMDKHFLMLEHLSLSFPADEVKTLTLPKTFLAPTSSLPSRNWPSKEIKVTLLHYLPRHTQAHGHPIFWLLSSEAISGTS